MSDLDIMNTAADDGDAELRILVESGGAVYATAAFLPSRAAACGRSVEEFGDCTITTSPGPTCAPACGTDERCVWGEGCTPTCVCYRPDFPTCEPACDPEAQACGWNEDCSAGQCLDIAPPLHAGTITITGGMTLSTVTGTWNENDYYIWDYSGEDWWAPTDTLHIEAPGASFPDFAMDVPAPEELVITTDTEAWTQETFDGMNDVPVAWTAGTGDIEIRVHSEMVSLICITEDDGSFDIPAAGIADIPENFYGLSGVTVSRRSSRVFNECANGEVTGIIETAFSVSIYM